MRDVVFEEDSGVGRGQGAAARVPGVVGWMMRTSVAKSPGAAKTIALAGAGLIFFISITMTMNSVSDKSIDTKKNFVPAMKRGFTLIELLVVIAIIALLSSILLVSLGTARKSSRDAVRLSAMREMQTALELAYDAPERYPDGDGAGAGGWDTPGNDTFITALVSGGHLRAHLRDPLQNDEYGNYKYFRFPAGSFGCDASRGAFYVLGIVDMESSNGAHPRSPGFSCPSRDFGSEMEFVFGRFEK